jgi:tripartite-type tricarboxylate transporter receptor subunit TctC
MMHVDKLIGRCGKALGLVVTLAMSLQGYAFADDYPSRAVTIIVPFPPGGSTDVQARLVAKGLSERLGKPVLVDNRPGAGGSIGAKAAASAAPDGHTMLFASTSSLVSEPVLRASGNIDVLRDFEAITQITDMPFLFVVASNSPHRTLADVIEKSRQRPGEATYASWGNGSVGHILGEMFKLSTKTQALHVPYKGEAQGVTDVMGGQVAMMFITPVNMPHIRGGKLRALAVTGDKRLGVLPDVPTFIESGFRGIDLPMWFGLVIPGKTPRDIITRLHGEIASTLKSSEFTRAAEGLGVTVVGSSPAEFTQRIKSDAALVADVAKAANIKFDN